ncbi:MAG: potassium/proton antiporter, partial [Actinomycetota bacterium]
MGANLNIGVAMLLVGGILATSVAAAFGAAKTRFPALVAFLGIGMLLGSDGPGGIAFDDAAVAREIGVVSLAAILYDGGLSTSWRRLRAVAAPAVLLSTVGVVVTAGITGVAAHALFPLGWAEALLLGSVVASTDAAAVFATLRNTRLRRGLARTLEAESGANDPVAIALTLGLIAWIERPHYGVGDFALLLARQLGVGLAVGVVLGIVAGAVFARIPPSIAAFAPVASVATAALAFGTADAAHGSGFLAVYLVGLAVGSTPSPYRAQLVTFHEGVAYVAQVGLFIVLGLLVFPSQLPHVALAAIGLTATLVVVARPVAVWLSIAPLRAFSRRERVLLGWAGLRGAVPIVLATFVLSSHLRSAD